LKCYLVLHFLLGFSNDEGNPKMDKTSPEVSWAMMKDPGVKLLCPFLWLSVWWVSLLPWAGRWLWEEVGLVWFLLCSCA
jgi:hypothetical protein